MMIDAADCMAGGRIVADTLWHYVRDGQPVGPITHADLCTLFAQKDLPIETLVWHEGLSDWLAATGVEDFRGIWGKSFGRRGNTPPPLPAYTGMHAVGMPAVPAMAPGMSPAIAPAPFAQPVESLTVRPTLEMRGRNRPPDPRWEKAPQLRPWIRYWARTLDHQLLFIVACLVYLPTNFWQFLAFFYGAFLAGALFFFPLQLVLFGRTFGKWVFGIHLENEEGEPLTMSQAIAREWGVFLNGMGLGILFLPIFTMITAYRRLMREGATSWDVSGGLLVRHRGVGPFRWIAFFGSYIALSMVQHAVTQRMVDGMIAEMVAARDEQQPRVAEASGMGSVMITPMSSSTSSQTPSTQPGVKKPRPKPKLLTLPGDKGAPNAQPWSGRREDRPAPRVVFKPEPPPESKSN
jgi:hypothetical protein